VRWLILVLALASAPVAVAQNIEALPILPVTMDSISDSAKAGMPASHRSAVPKVDRPVRVIECPEPVFPNIPSVYGYPVRVEFVYVVDTLGRPEMDDIVVKEATDPAFVPSARRAISKCRYEPARLNGRPVRFRVQRAVTYRWSSESPPDSR
jgi:hypothetical protein